MSRRPGHPPSDRPWFRRLPGRPGRVAVGVGAVLAVGGLSLGVVAAQRDTAGATSSTPSTPARSASPTGPSNRLGLPALGGSVAVHPRDIDDVGDPYILTVPPGTGHPTVSYVLYWTTDWQSNVPTAVSSDHLHWRRVADALPRLPSWAVPSITMTWGPTVRRVGDTYVLYYGTEAAVNHRECIGRATSSSPTGPYSDTSIAPLVCQTALGGDIDPSVVVTSPGSSNLVWKNDGNANGSPVDVWEQPLSADGLDVTGTPTRLLGADRSWEHGIIEGPSMLADSHGGWWLFYSGGTWQSDTYDTGVAHCATVAGPCLETSAGPLLASTRTAVSPGGFDTFTDGQGRLWASYSAFPFRPANPDQAMAAPRWLEIARVLAH